MSAKANKDFELPLGDVGRDTAHGKTAGQRDIRQEYAPFEKILRVFRCLYTGVVQAASRSGKKELPKKAAPGSKAGKNLRCLTS